MFEITLSTREFDSEARFFLRQAGGIFHHVIDSNDEGFPLVRFVFPNMRAFIDAMSSIADEREPRL